MKKRIVKNESVSSKIFACFFAFFLWLFFTCPDDLKCSQIGFKLGGTISNSSIDGVLGSEWNDANFTQSGYTGMGYLQDGAVGSLANYAVEVYSKRDANNLYIAFKVHDETQTSQGEALGLGERIIIQIDPNKSGGQELEHGSTSDKKDYRIEVYHCWGTPAGFVDKKFYDSMTKPSESVCNQQDWKNTYSFPIVAAVGYASTYYIAEFKIPFNNIGNPSGDIGIAFALVNVIGNCSTTTNTCDATGLAFPTSLPMNNNTNGTLSDPTNVAGCGAWLKPDNWGTGYFNMGTADVTISRNPSEYKSEAIDVVDCSNKPYIYYPDHPCKMQIKATLKNTSSTNLTRNLVYLAADYSTTPKDYEVIEIKEGIIVPPTAGTFSSNLWSGVHKNMKNAPCTRVVILPPAYNASFPKTKIHAISTLQDVENMQNAYGLKDEHWAMYNLSRHATLKDCPDPNCKIASLPIQYANLGLPIITHFEDNNEVEQSRLQHQSEIAEKTLPALKKIGKQVHLAARDIERDWDDNLIVQIRAYSYIKPKTVGEPHYNFIEELGGVVHVFPVEMVREMEWLHFEQGINNPDDFARTIYLQLDAHVPKSLEKLKFAIDTTPREFDPNEFYMSVGNIEYLIRKFVVGIYVGFQIPYGDFGKTFNPDLGFTCDLEYRLTPNFSVGVLLGRNQFKGVSNGKGLDADQVSLRGKYYLSSGILKPFITVGGGGYWLNSGSEKNGYNFGSGMQYVLTPALVGEVSYGFHSVTKTSPTMNFSTIQIGTKVRF